MLSGGSSHLCQGIREGKNLARGAEDGKGEPGLGGAHKIPEMKGRTSHWPTCV